MSRNYALILGVLATAVALPAQTWNEIGDAGDLPSNAQSPIGGSITQIDGSFNDVTILQGVGNDRDMYLIQIDDPHIFQAKTVAPAFNMQMFLFDINGMGVSFNDNNPSGVFDLQSRITGEFVNTPGLFYLAVSRFDRDPVSAGNQIWQDGPFNVERAPDGPAAGGVVDGWIGDQLSFGGGGYTILLTGVSAPPPANWTEVDDAGDLPATAQTPVGVGPLNRIDGTLNDTTIVEGVGNDRDMYLIQVDNPAAFTATTLAPALNTQLFLFDADGFGLSFNDNNPTAFSLEARVTGQFLPGPGLYYLVVSRFDRDPTSSGFEIWADFPLNIERIPDGPGQAGAIDGWNGTQLSFLAGSYSILMTGATFPDLTCSDLAVVGSGAPGTLLDFYLTEADPNSLAVLAFSQTEGPLVINFGTSGTLNLDIASPVSLLLMNVTDGNGDTVRSIDIPFGFPGFFDLYAQVFTWTVEFPPALPPQFVFCTSNVAPFNAGTPPGN